LPIIFGLEEEFTVLNNHLGLLRHQETKYHQELKEDIFYEYQTLYWE